MARKAEGSGKIRADLEGATLSLVDVEEVVPYIRQRIEQAIRRADLGDLLGPALDDMRRLCSSVVEAKSQIHAATAKLMER
jgi:hypothetical protein